MMIKYQITTKSYLSKPEKGSSEWCKMTWSAIDGSLEDLYNQIENNHFYRANLASTSNHGSKDFVSAQVIMFDYDKGDITMNDYVSRTKFKPTFYYMSHSSNSFGNKFRLGYVLDTPIYSVDEYKIIATAIANSNGVLTAADFDSKSFCPTQLWCGSEYELHKLGEIYSLDKLRTGIIEDTPKAFADANENNKGVISKIPVKMKSLTKDEQKIKDDFYNLSYKDFIFKYMQVPILQSLPISENEAFYFYDKDNYFEVIKKIEKNEDGKMSYYKKSIRGYELLRFADGECRRRKISASVSFIHQIKPNITLSELLAQALHYIDIYIDNTKDSISNHWIWNMVFDEFINPKNYDCKIKKSMKMKKEFFSNFALGKHHNSKIKEYKKQYCFSLYDFEKSIEDNVSFINCMLQEETNGVMNINKRTLTIYLKEENLIREKPITKIKKLYKHGLLTIDILDSYRDGIDRKTYFKYKKKIR